MLITPRHIAFLHGLAQKPDLVCWLSSFRGWLSMGNYEMAAHALLSSGIGDYQKEYEDNAYGPQSNETMWGCGRDNQEAARLHHYYTSTLTPFQKQMLIQCLLDKPVHSEPDRGDTLWRGEWEMDYVNRVITTFLM